MGNRWSVATVAIAMAFGASGQQAVAQQTTHGCACIYNKTESVVNFRYKWGEAEWRSISAKPNFKNWVCWKYADAQKSSPVLTFQLDVDLSAGNAWTTYNIARVQTTRAHCDVVGSGGNYNIRYRPNTNNMFIQVTKATP